MGFYYITFRSVTVAQRGEKILQGGGIHCTLMRTPHWMEEQGCGYCLKLWTQEVSSAVELLRRSRIAMRKVYIQRGDGHLEEVPL